MQQEKLRNPGYCGDDADTVINSYNNKLDDPNKQRQTAVTATKATSKPEVSLYRSSSQSADEFENF